MTWGAYSAIFSNTTSPSTVATAVRATASGLVVNLFSGKTAYGAENQAAGQAAQWAYSEMIETPERAAATGAAWNATNGGVLFWAYPGTASATAAASNATIGGTAPAILGGVASATGTARNATVANSPLGEALPTLTVRVDFAKDGAFTGADDDVSGRLLDGVTWTRGRNADLTGEATGSASFTLSNYDDRFTTAPTVLALGLPVHFSASYAGAEYPQFYGYIERIVADPRNETVTVTCYDVLRRMEETDVVVPGGVERSAHEFRSAILEDFERGDRNMLLNPHFATDTTYWTNVGGGGGLTRIGTDHCPETSGVTCGQFVAASISNRIASATVLTPQVFAGVMYRASIWLKWVSGATSVVLGLGGDPALGSPVGRFKAVTISGTWTKYTITHTVATTTSASEKFDGYIPFSISLMSTGAGTFLLDGAQVTRGQGAYPYSDTGTGRWPNWCANGSFEAGTSTGWYTGFTNLVTNPGFETDTSGWVTTGNAFVTGGATQTRTAGGALGSWHNAVAVGGTPGRGVSYAVTGTFLASVPYKLWVYVDCGGAGYGPITVGIGSAGTPADTTTATALSGASWVGYSVTWTPSADRTDAVVYVTSAGASFKIDAVFCAVASSTMLPAPQMSAVALPYCTAGVTGPGFSATAKYGSLSQSWTSLPVAGSGRFYDFIHSGSYFVAGRPYTVSLWLNPSSSMAYRVGIGASADAGVTWTDKTSATGTASADTWTQVVLTWTPSADRSGIGGAAQILIGGQAVLFLEQTDTTARTVRIDGVRVIPGSTADAFEMAQWSLAPEPDAYMPSASLASSALSCLTQINAFALTRHWIRPMSVSPWYTYVTSGRLDAKTSVETYNDDMTDLSAAEIDRASVVNLVPISFSNGLEYYPDPASIETYGLRPTGLIGGGYFFPSATIPEAISAALLARYGVPRARPTMTTADRFPSQLVREVGDTVTVTCTAALIDAQPYSILSFTTRVGPGWVTSYVLEEE